MTTLDIWSEKISQLLIYSIFFQATSSVYLQSNLKTEAAATTTTADISAAAAAVNVKSELKMGLVHPSEGFLEPLEDSSFEEEPPLDIGEEEATNGAVTTSAAAVKAEVK